MGEKVIGPGGARVPVPLVTSQSQPWPPDQLPGGDRGLFIACLATAENSGLGNPANSLTSGRLQSYLFQIGFNLIGRVPLHSNPLFHNVSFIHEISLINQKVRYLLTNADYSESLKCVNIIHPCDY